MEDNKVFGILLELKEDIGKFKVSIESLDERVGGVENEVKATREWQLGFIGEQKVKRVFAGGFWGILSAIITTAILKVLWR